MFDHKPGDTVNLFPHVLIRVAGGPFEKLESLNLHQSTQIVYDIHTLRVELAVVQQGLSEALYRVISTKTGSEVRVPLINLRRDIFNARNVSVETLHFLDPHLPPEVRDGVRRYRGLKEEIRRLRYAGQDVYAWELDVARRSLCRLARDGNLQKGLLLSSQSLVKHGLPRYLNRDSRSLKRRDLKTEQSLIKYISRIYAKTSPFSTFTNLAMGKIVNDVEQDLVKEDADPIQVLDNGEQPTITSHIRLNNYLYKYLKGLLIKNAEIRRWFRLRPNPTLREDGQHYLFLTNSNNVESFQRLPINPVLEMFRILTATQKQGIVYYDLLQTIVENEYIDASIAEIEIYLDQLIEYGFLEFNLGVSGIDPDWDLKLRQELSCLYTSVPLVDELLETLKQMRGLANQYGRADLENRERILEQAYDCFKAMCTKLHKAAGLPEQERQFPEDLKALRAEREGEAKGKDATAEGVKAEAGEQERVFKHQTKTLFSFRPEQMFYEDTTLDISPRLAVAEITPLISALHYLFREIRIFEAYHDERHKMRHHFVQKYGHNGSVDLLTFYEDYYREFKKPEAERLAKARKASQQEQEGTSQENDEIKGRAADGGEEETFDEQHDHNVLVVPAIQDRRERTRAWLDRFASIIKEQVTVAGGQINLNLQQIQRTNQALYIESHTDKNHNSRGVFVQLYYERNKTQQPQLMAVLNNSVPGYGKMLSRFLHLFDAEITNELCCWNQALYQDALLVENCDASYFNANLHPPLMPFEIWMPGGHNSLPAQQQIAVTELQVSLDEQADQLRLTHSASQKRVYVFDLGFQGQRGRSQLFRLLEKFTLAEYLSWHPLLAATKKLWRPQEAAEEQKVWVRPRVTYKDRLVLQRKAWFVPRELLPFRRPGETGWAYFTRLAEWRLEFGMPDEVFVFVIDREAWDSALPQALNKVGRDDYKPQYICFKNPFLVTLFEKLLHKVPKTLKIEEMLPDSQQLLTIGKSRYVTEFVIQWYEMEEGRN